jgi:protease I
MLNSQKLSGKKVAVLVADGFEMIEYSVPVNALRLAGAQVTVVSLRKGRIRGVNLHEPSRRIHADLTVEEAAADQFDELFIPGGFISPDLLRQSEAARLFVKAFEDANKPIGSLCHGPWVLSSAGILSGRRMTSWPGIRDDMVYAGATWLDQPVVRDRNWITSRGPQDLPQFVPALIEHFAQTTVELPSAVREVVVSEASSPQPMHPPEMMIRTMQWLPRPMFRGFALGALLATMAGLLLKQRPAV